MQFRYATWFDLLLLLFGAIAAIAHGAALPLLMFYFGDLVNTFISESITAQLIPVLQPMVPNDTVIDCSTLFNNTLTITDIIQMNFTEGMCLIGSDFINEINIQIFAFVGIGVGTFIAAYVQITFVQTAAERQIYKIRLKYYQSVLRQDIAWFDANPTGEIATRLSE